MAKPRKPVLVRKGATQVEVFNSGLEVWLYDDANRTTIEKKGLWLKLIDDGKTDGLLVGYSLYQDDELQIDIVVGAPLTDKELAAARWLEPQQAFLRLPSGKLAIESNDACRVGEEEPTDKGAFVKVPPGDYRVTLYRIDHEALKRDGATWRGSHEVVVLTPGGKKKDDVAGLLPFHLKRDVDWVGRVEIVGKTAKGLVWFEDAEDTYFANLDAAAARKLGLAAGTYFRTTVPSAGVSLTTVFADDWVSGAKLKPPAGPKLSEFGYGAIIQPEQWHPHQTLFARRAKAKKRIADGHQTQWLDATFEVLDLAAPAKPTSDDALHTSGKKTFVPASLAERDYFDDEPTALAMKLDGRLPDVTFEDELTLADAVKKIDAALAAVGLTPLGDFSFEGPGLVGEVEITVRAYGGLPDAFAAAWGGPDMFEVALLSRDGGGKWWITGTIDPWAAEAIKKKRLSVVGTESEVTIGDLVKAHAAHMKRARAKPAAAPKALIDLVRAFDDYVAAATE